MIEKSRLEGLIKQGATIEYYNYEPFITGAYNIIHISPFQLDNNCYVQSKKLYKQRSKERSYLDIFVAELKDLFETEEEAQWQLEFGNITRTETLSFPTWEEFKKGKCKIEFIANSHTFVCYHDTQTIYITEWVGLRDKDIFKETLSKENYIYVCRLCKKLFLGEK